MSLVWLVSHGGAILTKSKATTRGEADSVRSKLTLDSIEKPLLANPVVPIQSSGAHGERSWTKGMIRSRVSSRCHLEVCQKALYKVIFGK